VGSVQSLKILRNVPTCSSLRQVVELKRPEAVPQVNSSKDRAHSPGLTMRPSSSPSLPSHWARISPLIDVQLERGMNRVVLTGLTMLLI
jgi:hypothetical protein